MLHPVTGVCSLGIAVALSAAATRQTARDGGALPPALATMTRAVNAGDAATYASAYASDAVITIAGGRQLRGRGEIEQYERELLTQYPGTRFALIDVWRDGHDAVVRYGVNSPGPRPTGHEGLLFFTFDAHGLITGERRYLDAMTPMAQAGALGSSPARPLPALPSRPVVHAQSAAAEGVLDHVRDLLTALNHGGRADALARLSLDASIDELVLPSPLTGAGSSARWLDLWARAAPAATYEIAAIRASGSTVFVEGVLRGTLAEPFGPIRPAGVPFTVHRALVAETAGRAIVRISAFMNGREFGG